MTSMVPTSFEWKRGLSVDEQGVPIRGHLPTMRERDDEGSVLPRRAVRGWAFRDPVGHHP